MAGMNVSRCIGSPVIPGTKTHADPQCRPSGSHRWRIQDRRPGRALHNESFLIAIHCAEFVSILANSHSLFRVPVLILSP